MAWTQTDLDAIEKALASGTLVVKYNDKQVTYRSIAEMMQVRDMIRRALGKTNQTQRFTANFSKGLK